MTVPPHYNRYWHRDNPANPPRYDGYEADDAGRQWHSGGYDSYTSEYQQPSSNYASHDGGGYLSYYNKPYYADPENNLLDEPAPNISQSFTIVVSIILIVIANILSVTDIRVPFVGPAIGFWFLILFPSCLVYTTNIWKRSGAIERVGYSIMGVLLLLMLGGLAINTALPLLGIARPLESIQIVVLGDVLTGVLYIIRWRNPNPFAWSTHIRSLRPGDARLLITAALCPVLATLGANRLNNGASSSVSLIGLAAMVGVLFFLLRWHQRFRDEVISIALYLVALSLLLMTSLRGWYVTGHDIQTEYRVFQLTESHGRWNISDYHSAYNACLSITILPAEIARVVHVFDPYVYKVFFQLLFALCPVLVYTICRRFGPKLISLLATIYFIGFPTFFGDMPFLNRQEVAFLFVCIGILSVTNTAWSQAWRRIGLFIAAAGVELSHYSTMYLFFGMVLVAWLLGVAISHGSKLFARPRAMEDHRWAGVSRTIGLGSVLVVAAVMGVWGGLIAHTSGTVLADAETAVSQFTGSNSATPYSLLSGSPSSPQQSLEIYRASELKQNEDSPTSLYVPASAVAQYSTPIVNEPDLPLTSIGQLLSNVGIPIETLNTVVRQGAAKDEQLFVLVGFAAFMFSRRLRRRVSGELLCISVGSIFMVALFTVLPSLSVDYGVLRAFQEALIVTAPVLALGSIVVFRPFGEKWSVRFAASVCMLTFISTCGLMPQVLGGYPAQLSLNNSGQYYDIFYTQPQEVSAVNWLVSKPDTSPVGVQAPMGTSTADRFEFNTPATVNGRQYVSDIYPALVQRSSWMIVSYSIVRADRAPLSVNGQLFTYLYPIGLLESSKNLVFNDGGAEVYK